MSTGPLYSGRKQSRPTRTANCWTKRSPTEKSMNRLPKLLLYCLPLVLAACSKKLVPPIVGTPRPELAIEQIDFESFSGKARMLLRDGSKVRDVKTNIRIRKDSVIWMSFSVIGVQGGKALINHDSITIVNNVDNEYFVFEYEELSRRFN